MKRKENEINESIINILARAKEQGAQPVAELCIKFNLSRQQISRYLSALVKKGMITTKGHGRGQKYFLAKDIKDYPIASLKLNIKELTDLGEDRVYQIYLKPFILSFKENIQSILYHGFTELVNNVIDHAESNHFSFSLTKNQINKELILKINDDGIGVFKRNKIAFACNNLYEAVIETAKGKRTSQPQKHAGEGLFFTSRLFDYFSLKANGIEWIYLSNIDDWSIASCKEEQGTHITLKINSNSNRKPEEVFKKYTDEDFQFTKNALFIVEPLTIMAEHEHVSRSEAKRLLIGADKFKEIIIDFKNTKRIGQGFADEVFRVFQNEHPKIIIKPRNMNEAVNAMVKHVMFRLPNL